MLSLIPTYLRRMVTCPALPRPLLWPWARALAGWRLGLTLLALLVGGLMLLPLAYLLLRAAGSGETAVATLLRPSTFATLWRTLLLAGSVTFASAVIAVPLAWLTSSTDLPGRRAWAVAVALPLVLPSYVAAYLLAATFGPRGAVQQMLEPLGIMRLPEIYGFPGAFIALTLMGYPYIFLTTRAAFRRLDPALMEAGRSLGLSARAVFWRVTLPQLRPAMMAGGLLVALYVLRDFGAVTMMRYDTFTRLIFVQYRSFADRSVAAVLALVLVTITAVFVAAEMRTRGRAGYARRSAGAARQMRPVRLGRWRWPALLLLALWVTLTLLGPTGSLAYWLWRGQQMGTLTPAFAATLGSAAWNSLTVSLATAVAAIVAALPVAILSVRQPGQFSRFLEQLTYAGYALPGIVVALAFVFFGAQYAPFLYQTLPMLVLAYLVLFVPQAVGGLRASLLQLTPSLEEAGRSLGQTAVGVFWRISLPLLRPGLLAALALVFLTTMKELPATLMLSPFGYRTLATAVWHNISEAMFAQAAAPSLLLLLLASIPLAILTLRDR